MVSARALWWSPATACECGPERFRDYPCSCEGGWAAPMTFGELDGVTYLTDGFVLLPVHALGGLPVGYDQVLAVGPMRPQAMDGFAMWLATRPVSEPSDRAFARSLIDPIEEAGFRLRPLEGVKDAHGICDDELQVIGLAIPVRRNLEFSDSKYSRLVDA